jgi:23S rRNA pseudouridine1911/1915/1917 synthase
VGALHVVAIDRGDVGIRLDRVLLRHLSHIPGVTRNRIQRLIANGAVCVDGHAATRPAARVPPGSELSIELPDRPVRAIPAGEAIPLAIMYEDADLLIVDKPAGQVSHPAFRNPSGTLVNALVAHARGHWTPSLVSRLDKDTSGLVLVAKTRAIHRALQQLAFGRAIDKDYLAIVSGKPPSRGTIDLALDRDPWDRRRVTVRDRGGVPSVTTFARVATTEVPPRGVFSLVRCRLVTGRMHQIRVHLAAKGWRIIGDPVYGPRRGDAGLSLPMRRQALHASRLALTHPTNGGRIEVTAPLPEDMRQLLVTIGLDRAFAEN